MWWVDLREDRESAQCKDKCQTGNLEDTQARDMLGFRLESDHK